MQSGRFASQYITQTPRLEKETFGVSDDEITGNPHSASCSVPLNHWLRLRLLFIAMGKFKLLHMKSPGLHILMNFLDLMKLQEKHSKQPEESAVEFAWQVSLMGQTEFCSVRRKDKAVGDQECF